MKKHCFQCGKEFLGRTDKRFCSILCKNQHHFQKRQSTINEVREIDAYLHRNREILMTLMGSSVKETIDKYVLTRAKFRWEYMTGIYWNKEGKMYRLIYDFAWMDFSDQRVLIVRKKHK